MFLWAEAWNIIVYVYNRIPRVILRDKTTKEALTRVNPKIGHLRIFGCPIYIHVPTKKRMKLEPLR